MEYHDNSIYSYIQPKNGEQGIKFAFDVCLEKLSKDEKIRAIDEIKSLKIPVWWDLQSSPELFALIHGKEKEAMNQKPQDGDELAFYIYSINKY